MSEPTQSAGVLVIHADKVLLVRHSESARHHTDSYGIPGGRVDPGESLVEAAARELREETGLIATIEKMRPLPTVYRSVLQLKHGPEQFIFTVFLCPSYSGELQPSKEGVPEWVASSELDKYELIGDVKSIIQEGLNIVH